MPTEEEMKAVEKEDRGPSEGERPEKEGKRRRSAEQFAVKGAEAAKPMAMPDDGKAEDYGSDYERLTNHRKQFC